MHACMPEGRVLKNKKTLGRKETHENVFSKMSNEESVSGRSE